MGAFAVWLADLGRKISIYTPVLVLMLGAMLAWSTYQATVWGVAHIPIPFEESLSDLFTRFADFISESDGFAVWLLNLFAIDILLQYFISILDHLRLFISVLSGLFTALLAIMVFAYQYNRAKRLASVLSGNKLL